MLSSTLQSVFQGCMHQVSSQSPQSVFVQHEIAIEGLQPRHRSRNLASQCDHTLHCRCSWPYQTSPKGAPAKPRFWMVVWCAWVSVWVSKSGLGLSLSFWCATFGVKPKWTRAQKRFEVNWGFGLLWARPLGCYLLIGMSAHPRSVLFTKVTFRCEGNPVGAFFCGFPNVGSWARLLDGWPSSCIAIGRNVISEC